MSAMTLISGAATISFLGVVRNKVSQRCLGRSLSNIVRFFSFSFLFQGDNSTGFPKHSSTPPISKKKENPYFSNNSGGVEINSFESKLLKTHGMSDFTFSRSWLRSIFAHECLLPPPFCCLLAGILMMIAFPVLVVFASFIAAWTRPLFGPEGWSQVRT